LTIGCRRASRDDLNARFGRFVEQQQAGTSGAATQFDANRSRRIDRRDEAEEIMHRLEEEARQSYVRADVLAMGYAALGDTTKAFGCLDRAHQTRSAGLIYLHLDPGYAPLRGDPRFNQLTARIGLR
jgi:hypothetical protein